MDAVRRDLIVGSYSVCVQSEVTFLSSAKYEHAYQLSFPRFFSSPLQLWKCIPKIDEGTLTEQS